MTDVAVGRSFGACVFYGCGWIAGGEGWGGGGGGFMLWYGIVV